MGRIDRIRIDRMIGLIGWIGSMGWIGWIGLIGWIRIDKMDRMVVAACYLRKRAATIFSLLPGAYS